MRTPARPRLPDGDCVFISGGWIVARANAPGIAADMALLGFAPRCILVYIAFSLNLRNKSKFETERELAPLLSVRDAFPKVLIARTRHELYPGGRSRAGLARWLLGEQGF